MNHAITVGDVLYTSGITVASILFIGFLWVAWCWWRNRQELRAWQRRPYDSEEG